jgi:PST family polysaccharide transporter
VRQTLASLASVAALTSSRILTALAVNKVVAVQTGPAGVALLGSFQNLTAIALALGGACISQGLVVTLARATTSEQRRELLASAFSITLAGCACVALILLVVARPLAGILFGDPSLVLPIYMLALLLIPNVLNANLWNALSGLGDRQSFLIVGVGIAALTVGLIYPMAAFLGLAGVLSHALVANALAVGLSLPFVLRRMGGSAVNPRFSAAGTKKLLRFAPMAIATIVFVPGSQIIVRDMLIGQLGSDQAGYWQGLLRMSDAYLLALTYLVVLVMAPRLALVPRVDLWRGALRMAGLVAAGVAVLAAIIMLGRSWLVPLLFSSEFAPMQALFPYHLAGDVVRSVMVVMGAALTAAAKPRGFVLMEAVNAVLFVGFTAFSLPAGGVLAVTQAYLAAGTLTAFLGAWLVHRYSSGK